MQRILLIIFFLPSFIGYSQSNNKSLKNNINNDGSVLVWEKYVIGIANSDDELFNSILNDLKNDAAINVYAVCNEHHIIGFNAHRNTYKSYDIIRDHLQNKYFELTLLRKDESIFSKDCSDEILKQ